MHTQDVMVREALAAMEREPRINLHRSPLTLTRIEDGTLVLFGEVANIEEKRLAVERARSVKGLRHIVDQLRVRPTTWPGDGAIRDALFRHLSEELVFLRTAISCRVAGDVDTVARSPANPDGAIYGSVHEGVVHFLGHVMSLSHRRLVGVLAWWTPGCRDVRNDLEIRPAESDNDDEITDAIKLVLDKDPLVHGDRIAVRVRQGSVQLRGFAATPEEKRMAAQDAWYIDGVRDVVNEIEVYQTLGPGRPMPLPLD